MFHKALFTATVLLAGIISARGEKKPAPGATGLRDGDIVFQYIPCGELCVAIVETTPCGTDRPFNHCGIVTRRGDSIAVIEAIGSSVHASSLKVFMSRDTSAVVYAGRPVDGVNVNEAIAKANLLSGRPYDDAFLPGDSALYCSELIYACYSQGGKLAFTLEPMTFISPRTGQTYPAWADYYKSLRLPIPEGVPGINPCAISRSPLIRMMSLPKRQLLN